MPEPATTETASVSQGQARVLGGAEDQQGRPGRGCRQLTGGCPAGCVNGQWVGLAQAFPIPVRRDV